MLKQLGNLEEVILLLVMNLQKEEAYGVAIAQMYEQQLGKSISLPAIHTVLKRLEVKKLVRSFLGESTKVRGGKQKRLYQVTEEGVAVLAAIQDNRKQLWNLAMNS